MSSEDDSRGARRFAVQLAGAEGETTTVEIEAADAAQAARIAGRRGRALVSVREIRTRRRGLAGSGGRKAAVRLSSELSLLLKSGMTIEQALSALTRFSARQSHTALARALLQDVRSGRAFHEAVAARPEVFPAPFAQVAQAGEASGSLGAALSDLADYLEARQRFEDALRGAMIYPAILLVGAFLATVTILIFVVPRFEALFTDTAMTLPASTAFVFAAARGAVVGVPVLGAVMLIGLVVFRIRMRSPGFRQAWHRLLLNLPLLGAMNREAMAARFSRLLALMLKNGLSAAPALRLAAAATGNAHARERLDAAVGRVRTGRGFAEEIASAGVLPDMVCELLKVGEEGGDLAGAASRLADVYEDRVKRTADLVLRLIEPAIIIFVGLILGGIIVSILLALVSANDAAF